MNSAMPMLTGTAITRAISELNSVPQMNASAPKTSSAGAQRCVSEEARSPISENTGRASGVVIRR